jgi:hypothetical protein
VNPAGHFFASAAAALADATPFPNTVNSRTPKGYCTHDMPYTGPHAGTLPPCPTARNLPRLPALRQVPHGKEPCETHSKQITFLPTDDRALLRRKSTESPGDQSHHLAVRWVDLCTAETPGDPTLNPRWQVLILTAVAAVTSPAGDRAGSTPPPLSRGMIVTSMIVTNGLDGVIAGSQDSPPGCSAFAKTQCRPEDRNI